MNGKNGNFCVYTSYTVSKVKAVVMSQICVSFGNLPAATCTFILKFCRTIFMLCIIIAWFDQTSSHEDASLKHERKLDGDIKHAKWHYLYKTSSEREQGSTGQNISLHKVWAHLAAHLKPLALYIHAVKCSHVYFWSDSWYLSFMYIIIRIRICDERTHKISFSIKSLLCLAYTCLFLCLLLSFSSCWVIS